LTATRLHSISNPDLGRAGRGAHLFAEALLAQVGAPLAGIDLRDTAWSRAGSSGVGVLAYIVACGLAPADRVEAWAAHALGLADDPGTPPGFRRLPEEVLRPGYRLPSSHGRPEGRGERLWDILPIPASAPPPGAAHPTVSRVAPPDAVFEYRDQGGALVLRVCRWEPDTVGAPGKLVLPEVWATPARQPNAPARLVPAWPHASIPLYNEAEVRARPGDWVLILEGEKAAIAGRRRFPRLAVTSVAGGLVSRADWGALAGRSVMILPDQDVHGFEHAQRVRQMATAAGATRAVIVHLPQGAPDGWDIADPLPAGWTEQTIERALETAARTPAPAPDLSLLQAARRAPEPWPEEILAPALRGHVRLLAQAAGVAPDFVGLPFLSLPAALAGGLVDCAVRPGWAERGCLIWGVAIGDPSSGKSPAAAPFLEAVGCIERKLAAEHAARLLESVLQASAAKRGDPKPPKVAPLEIVRAGNVTAAAIAPILAAQRRGLVVLTDELSTWIQNLDAGYRGRGATDRAFWLRAYDAGTETYIRRTVGNGDPLLIDPLAVGVCAWVQPDPLSKAMAPDAGPVDGLYDRMLVAWPEPPPASAPDLSEIAFEIDLLPQALALWADRLFELGRRLQASGERLTLRFSPEAAAAFDSWRVRFIEEQRREHSTVSAFAGKAPGQAVRLAVARHLGEWAAGTDADPAAEIDLATVEHAISARAGYFAAHRQRLDQDAAEPQDERNAREVARWVVRERARVVRVADLRRRVRLPGLRTDAAILGALRVLQQAGWIAPAVVIPDARDWRAAAPADLPLVPQLVDLIARL